MCVFYLCLHLRNEEVSLLRRNAPITKFVLLVLNRVSFFPGFSTSRESQEIFGIPKILVTQCVEHIAIGAEGLGFDSKGGLSGHRVATAVTFLRSCVAMALSCGHGPRKSLHAST